MSCSSHILTVKKPNLLHAACDDQELLQDHTYLVRNNLNVKYVCQMFIGYMNVTQCMNTFENNKKRRKTMNRPIVLIIQF